MIISEKRTKKARAIAAAAVEAIREKGLDHFKLTDVARKAGVTTGAVTYYFDDKDALLTAAFEETWKRMFGEIEAFEGGWKIERFFNSLPITQENQNAWAVWLAFCGRAQTSEAINTQYRAFYSKLEALLLDSIKPSHPEVTPTAIRTVIAAMDGIGLCATLHPELWPPKRQRECLKDLLSNLFNLETTV